MRVGNAFRKLLLLLYIYFNTRHAQTKTPKRKKKKNNNKNTQKTKDQRTSQMIKPRTKIHGPQNKSVVSKKVP